MAKSFKNDSIDIFEEESHLSEATDHVQPSQHLYDLKDPTN